MDTPNQTDYTKPIPNEDAIIGNIWQAGCICRDDSFPEGVPPPCEFCRVNPRIIQALRAAYYSVHIEDDGAQARTKCPSCQDTNDHHLPECPRP